MLMLSDFTSEIDRLLIVLDIGCIALVGYWIGITLCGQYELRMNYLTIGLLYGFIDIGSIAYVELGRLKEKKEKVYHRECFDIHKETEILQVCENTYRCVYASNKKSEEKAIVIFWPSSYYMVQDMEGFGYGVLAKNEWRRQTNIGAYEELADCLVHSGYGTVRIEAERTENVNPYVVEALAHQIEDFLYMKKTDTQKILLLHGPSNRLLPEIYPMMTVNGVISLCGAAMSCSAEQEQLRLWNPEKKMQLHRTEQQIACENPVLFTEEKQKKTTDDWIKELVSVADEVPVLVGYAEQDPYYGVETVNKICEQNHSNITNVFFKGADFTLRECNPNKKIHYDGYLPEALPGLHLHPLIGEKLIEWLSTCIE
jgi:hypothetical protein